MMATPEERMKKEDQNKTSNPLRCELQGEWISDEELYTEGSSDEDDMALRMKRREQIEQKKGKFLKNVPEESLQLPRISHKQVEGNSSNEQEGASCEEGPSDDIFKWRPTQGNFRFKNPLDPDLPSLNEEESKPTLSEAYSNMHTLDAMLRDSDRQLKEAQAETLRAQLSTRKQLSELREQLGEQNVVLSRNWDAFMQLCPYPTLDPAQAAAGRSEAQGSSVLPRISGAESDGESDDSESSAPALAITDEEKLKLSALLRDLDQEKETAALSGYQLDAEARRCLDRIDNKLQELVPDSADSWASSVARGATRKQRLEDIDRCLEALAASAAGDVEPVGEDEVRTLLLGDPRGSPRGGAGDGGQLDATLISDLLQEARRELPGFRFRHYDDDEGKEVDDTTGAPTRALGR